MSTLDKLKKAMESCDGKKETIALILCNNETATGCCGCVGDAAILIASLHSMLHRMTRHEICREENFVLTGIMNAIARADIQCNGLITAHIEEMKAKILEIGYVPPKM